MNTHTIRLKGSKNPIVTFTPKFFAQLLKAEPAASNLTLAWFKVAYKNLTGKTIRVHYEQELLLLERYGADEKGTWRSRFDSLSGERYVVVCAFMDGLLSRTTGSSIEQILSIASTFYSLVEVWLKEAPPVCPLPSPSSLGLMKPHSKVKHGKT